MTRAIFIFIFVLMGGYLLAWPSYAVDDPVASVHYHCVANRAWMLEQCQMVNTSKEMYQTNLLTDLHLGAYANTEYYVSEFTAATNPMSYFPLPNGKKHGSELRNAIVDDLRSVIREQKLNDCQKACIVKCASSNILTYQYNFMTRFGPIDRAYEQGTGICTEFQQVADDLGAELGVNMQYASGFNHHFNWFYINGQWVLGEPQNNDCKFFLREQLSTSELKQYTDKLNGNN